MQSSFFALQRVALPRAWFNFAREHRSTGTSALRRPIWGGQCQQRVGTASSHDRGPVVGAARPPSCSLGSAVPRIAAAPPGAGSRTECQLDGAHREYARRPPPAAHAAKAPVEGRNRHGALEALPQCSCRGGSRTVTRAQQLDVDGRRGALQVDYSARAGPEPTTAGARQRDPLGPLTGGRRRFTVVQPERALTTYAQWTVTRPMVRTKVGPIAMDIVTTQGSSQTSSQSKTPTQSAGAVLL